MGGGAPVRWEGATRDLEHVVPTGQALGLFRTHGFFLSAPATMSVDVLFLFRCLHGHRDYCDWILCDAGKY